MAYDMNKDKYCKMPEALDFKNNFNTKYWVIYLNINVDNQLVHQVANTNKV